MTAATAKKRRYDDHPARPLLSGVIYALNQTKDKDKPSVELLRQVRDQVQSAYDLLGVRDDLSERVGFILLMIRQSTAFIVTVGVGGRTIERVKIVDPEMYTLAIKRLHTLIPDLMEA